MTTTKQDRLRNMADAIEATPLDAHPLIRTARVRVSLYRSVADDLDRLDDFAADNARLRAGVQALLPTLLEAVHSTPSGKVFLCECDQCKALGSVWQSLRQLLEVGP